ncbi:MAG: hypothetical protein KGN76_14265 [Acidobacteriota bacterium]|nr:hypothetical protein [Acidobacteriota bacterium]
MLPSASAGPPSARRDRLLVVILSLAIFIVTLAIRVRGIGEHFWLLEDQMRDWGIALRPFTQLPLVGSPTHVGGYTIGPAFYWILWLIRVTFGPWFHDLPHGGGIGQATLTSAVDVVLFAAVWKRTQSPWLGVTAVAVLATASFPLSLAAVIWNPVMGATLSELAIALVVLGWADRSLARTGIVAAVAWSAVHAYTGAIFVALGVFAALVLEPLLRRDRRAAARVALAVAAVVVLLQVPYAVHAWRSGPGPGGMDAVSGSIAQIVTGRAPARFAVSASGYATAVNYDVAGPWSVPAIGWVMLGCALLLAFAYRRDPVLLVVVLLPQVLAVVGFAFWLSGLDPYFYLPIMPAAVLTLTLALPGVLPSRAARPVAVAMLAAALIAAPFRVRSATLFQLPEYGALVRGARTIISMGTPIQEITTAFDLPQPFAPIFIYRILGGQFDPHSPWTAEIEPGGRVEFHRVAPQ